VICQILSSVSRQRVRALQSVEGMEARKSRSRSPLRFSEGLFAAVTGFALLFAGARCSQFTGVFEKPELQFRGLRVDAVGLEKASLEILVDVYNPNSDRLRVDRFSYDLAIEDTHWGLGSTTDPIMVAGRNSATVALPLDVSWSRLGAAGREALRTGSVNYGVSGEMRVGTSVGDVSVPYSKTGRFSILNNQESSDPGTIRIDVTSRFRLASYSTRIATPFSKMIFFPTLL
jgi:LEA14-like dessication related protein